MFLKYGGVNDFIILKNCVSLWTFLRFSIFSQPNSFNRRSVLVSLNAPVHIRAALRWHFSIASDSAFRHAS